MIFLNNVAFALILEKMHSFSCYLHISSVFFFFFSIWWALESNLSSVLEVGGALSCWNILLLPGNLARIKGCKWSAIRAISATFVKDSCPLTVQTLHTIASLYNTMLTGLIHNLTSFLLHTNLTVYLKELEPLLIRSVDLVPVFQGPIVMFFNSSKAQ